MRRIIATAVLFFTLATPSRAGFDDGVAAYDRGDYTTALHEFRVLAEQGNIGAQAVLGLMYRTGLGTTLDYVEAAKWYSKAAQQGLTTAQSTLGLMYHTGLGVPQDHVRSYMWLSLAARHGNMDRLRYRDNFVAKHMTVADISQAQQLVREWRTEYGKEL